MISWLQLHCCLSTWCTWNSATPEVKEEKEALLHWWYNPANTENRRVLTIFTLLFLCFAFIFLTSVTICVYKVWGKEAKTQRYYPTFLTLLDLEEGTDVPEDLIFPTFHSITTNKTKIKLNQTKQKAAAKVQKESCPEKVKHGGRTY